MPVDRLAHHFQPGLFDPLLKKPRLDLVLVHESLEEIG
jgi:hypothetical protein